MNPDDPILSFDEQHELCERCGRCCIATYADMMLGGTIETDAWLRMPSGECRFLRPPDHQGLRRCAIHDAMQVLPDQAGGWSIQKVRPALCRNSPTRKNVMSLPDCPVRRAAEERVTHDV